MRTAPEANPLEPAVREALDVLEPKEPITAPLPDEASPLPPKPFAEELPEGFWGDDLELPDVPQTARNASNENFDEAFAAPANTARPTPTPAVKLADGGLEADPRFTLLQSLFPGRISDWQPAQAPTEAATEGLEDAPGTPETVDLEEGLDADEDGESD